LLLPTVIASWRAEDSSALSNDPFTQVHVFLFPENKWGYFETPLAELGRGTVLAYIRTTMTSMVTAC
jgi:hypothetical protein